MKNSVLVTLLLLISVIANTQVIINEVCAKNKAILFDEDNDTPDWIELYNTSSSPIQLKGYFLSDKADNLFKWTFPDVTIQPQSYLVLLASNKDTNRTYIHTNFKISGNETISLSNDQGDSLDQVTLPELDSDLSYGSQPDGSAGKFVFPFPTPGATNNNADKFQGALKKVVFNLSPGIHDHDVAYIIMSCENSEEIRFTTDGNDPTDTSKLFDEFFAIYETTTIKAKAFAKDYLPSEIETNTYILNKQTHLPILSITTPPDYLWDDSTGIYVTGFNADTVFPYPGANFWMDIEIPAHLEFFEDDNSLGFEQDLGMMIHGGSISRTRPQKSFRFLAKDKYGKDKIEYQLFKDKPVNEFKRFILRNSGGDFGRTMFRDGFVHQHIMDEGLDIDVLAYRPAVVYLNGRYWGLMNIREKFDKHYLNSNYAINTDDVIILEEEFSEIEGSFAHFDTLHQYVVNNEMSLPENYQYVITQLDISSYVDYFLTEIHMLNRDWPGNNIKFWKTTDSDSKWRYMLFDLDGAFNFRGWTEPTYNFLDTLLNRDSIPTKHIQILDNLLKNREFKNYFINRYADLINTSFSTATFMKKMNQVKNHIEPEMSDHFKKWPIADLERWVIVNMDTWQEEIDEKVIDWIEVRPEIARNHVQSHFNLEKQVTLNLAVYPEGAGEIVLNTIQPESLPWSGVYYKGVPVTIEIKPNPGYEFDYWLAENSFGKNPNTSLKIDLQEDEQLIAVFESDNSNVQVKTYPNPFTDINNVSLLLLEEKHMNIQLVDAYGKGVIDFGDKTFSMGVHEFMIPGEQLSHGVYFLHLNSKNYRKVVKLVCIK